MPDSTTISKGSPGLHMWLASEAENVAVVRHALAGMAAEMGMDEAGVADLKTVVTEACMNVVVHAYPDGPGEIAISAVADRDGLEVTVSDEGVGIRPEADPPGDSLRLGISLIAALCAEFSISGGAGRGTEVRMKVPFKAVEAAPKGDRQAPPPGPRPGARMAVADPAILGPVLERMVGAIAADSELPVERLADAVLLTDAIAAAAPARFGGEPVTVRVGGDGRGVELRLGPMAEGAASAIEAGLELPDGGSVAQLADHVGVERDGSGELLVIRVSAPR